MVVMGIDVICKQEIGSLTWMEVNVTSFVLIFCVLEKCLNLLHGRIYIFFLLMIFVQLPYA